ncbi:MAG: glucose-1-phosphate cytidylyltransferase [Candidatus Omnitrophica bacterium]|nr:glucose-1-phosphate cytidylyltransferase [Candidatus Omnitrophota bacterium]
MCKIKAVILCGGQGTRIRDVSEVLPKPMLTIGNMPILWHIMKTYSHYGVKDFVLCLGYKGWVIKEFFLNYYAKISDITVRMGEKDSIIYHNVNDEAGWNITMVETGENAQTGARIWNARKYLEDCDMFSVTYGDGVADIDIKALIKKHKDAKVSGTVTGVHPSGRFGEMEISDDMIKEFNEKPNVGMGLINGGFMLFDKGVIKRYFRPGDDLVLETEVLPKMVKDKQLGIYKHGGFWQCVDTPREYGILNHMWDTNKAIWKVWQ